MNEQADSAASSGAPRGLRRVHVTASYPHPPETVFDLMAEHETMGRIYPVRIRRRQDGHESRNGVGSVRALYPFGLPPAVEETITAFRRPELIEYKITRGGPLIDHHGTMTFAKSAAGLTTLDYQIEFRSRIPGMAWFVRQLLTFVIRRGLPGLTSSHD